MTVFYFVRHGKTEYNLEGIFQGGRSDSPLLPEGITGAKKVGKYLEKIKFDAAFVSPQGRAQATADLILAENDFANIEKKTDSRLKELDFGDWDGKSGADFHDQPEYLNLKEHPGLYNPTSFHGESYQTLLERVRKFFDEITRRYPDGKILVVAHAIVISTLLNDLAGEPLSLIRKNGLVANTSLSVVEDIDQKIRIVRLNDTSFLK